MNAILQMGKKKFSVHCQNLPYLSTTIIAAVQHAAVLLYPSLVRQFQELQNKVKQSRAFCVIICPSLSSYQPSFPSSTIPHLPPIPSFSLLSGLEAMCAIADMELLECWLVLLYANRITGQLVAASKDK